MRPNTDLRVVDGDPRRSQYGLVSGGRAYSLRSVVPGVGFGEGNSEPDRGQGCDRHPIASRSAVSSDRDGTSTLFYRPEPPPDTRNLFGLLEFRWDSVDRGTYTSLTDRLSMTVRYTLGCDLSYDVKSPTVFIFNLEVAKLVRHHDLVERLTITPDHERRTYVVPDIHNRYFSIDARPGPLNVRYEADVTLDVFRADPNTVEEVLLNAIPLDIMPFLLPSRFVPSDRLAAFAEKEFGSMPKGHRRVTAICNWIYDNIDYQRGSSNEQTTAIESLVKRAGVCRDFSHIGIAFCRALDIPARFVSCYAYGLEPRDFHAVFEAYLDGRWWLFDATRQANLDGLVRIGAGRHAAEIAFASPFGKMEAGPVLITIEHADGTPETLGRTTDAISTEEPAPNAGAN